MTASGKIVEQGQMAAVVLPREVLAQIGLAIGDTVDLRTVDQHLVVSSPSAAAEPPLTDLIREVFSARADAYRRLA